MNAILLIGNYVSSEVDSYSWWQDLPNISEYDTIILDTTKLRSHWDGRLEHVEESTYTLLGENDLDDRIHGNLSIIKNKLLEKMEFDASIYVLYTPEISVYRPPRNPIHTESWRPLSFNPVLESGKIIDVIQPSYRAYFSGFRTYRFYFSPDSIDIAKIRDYYVGKWAVTSQVKEIAVNKVRKPLAFELVLSFHEYATDEEALSYEPAERPYESVAHHKGCHLILLPVSNDHDSIPAIEDILKISRQSEYIPPPPWVDSVQIPGESTVLSKIEALEQQTRTAN